MSVEQMSGNLLWGFQLPQHKVLVEYIVNTQTREQAHALVASHLSPNLPHKFVDPHDLNFNHYRPTLSPPPPISGTPIDPLTPGYTTYCSTTKYGEGLVTQDNTGLNNIDHFVLALAVKGHARLDSIHQFPGFPPCTPRDLRKRIYKLASRGLLTLEYEKVV